MKMSKFGMKPSFLLSQTVEITYLMTYIWSSFPACLNSRLIVSLLSTDPEQDLLSFSKMVESCWLQTVMGEKPASISTGCAEKQKSTTLSAAHPKMQNLFKRHIAVFKIHMLLVLRCSISPPTTQALTDQEE